MIDEDKVRGALFGQAIGDALGLGAEFLSPEEVASRYPNGLRHYSDIDMSRPFTRQWKPGEWTDDTDQALCIFDSLLEHQGEVIPTDIARRFVKWYEEDGRGAGGTTVKIITSPGYLDDPCSIAASYWEESGRQSAPNGGVMRTSVVGLFYEDAEITAENARLICRVTHADPRCQASAEIISSVIQELVHGFTVSRVGRALDLIACEEFCPINDVPILIGALEGDLQGLGLGEAKWSYGYTVKTLGVGIWALSPEAENFEDALQLIIREGGDVDTNCAVAGAVMGARFGFQALPLYLVRGLVKRDELHRRVDSLMEYRRGA